MQRPLVTVFVAALAALLFQPGGEVGHENTAQGGTSCVGLDRPVPGPVVELYGPIGRYAGHWGVDLGATPGTQVRAAAGGTVTFAGSVAHNLTVTVEHGGGLKTSYSYLAEVSVGRSARVARGARLGSSGPAHGSDALHFSVRVDGRYVDPLRYLGCHARGPAGAVYLVPAYTDAGAYAPRRATRHPRRDFRPTPPGASHGGRSGIPPARPRRGDVAPGRGPLAKGRSSCLSCCASVGDDESVGRWG